MTSSLSSSKNESLKNAVLYDLMSIGYDSDDAKTAIDCVLMNHDDANTEMPNEKEIYEVAKLNIESNFK